MGAFLQGGRWNTRGKRVVYCAATYAGALLEQLVHAQIGRLPKNQVYIEITIPEDLPIDVVAIGEVPEWNADHMQGSQKRGDRWLREGNAIALVVPSAVTAGIESNVLINPDHLEFRRVSASEPAPVEWDQRLVRT